MEKPHPNHRPEMKGEARMGWASGTDLIIDVWGLVRHYVPQEDRVQVCKSVIKRFENMDWDCQDEFGAVYPEAEQALKEMYPQWYE